MTGTPALNPGPPGPCEGPLVDGLIAKFLSLSMNLDELFQHLFGPLLITSCSADLTASKLIILVDLNALIQIQKKDWASLSHSPVVLSLRERCVFITSW